MFQGCHLCKNSLTAFPLPVLPPFEGVRCSTCGEYSVASDVIPLLENRELTERLSWRVREKTDGGEQTAITADNYQQLADVPVPPVPQKLFHLLQELGRQSIFPGDWVRLNWLETLCRLKCQWPGEVAFLATALIHRGLVVKEPGASPDLDNSSVPLQVTPEGWEALEPVLGAGIPGVCFVAMSFTPDLQAAYDIGIQPAIVTDCELRALRVDREEHNDQITDRIIAGIRSSQVVIADVTGQRPNVYYEAGFAQGLGRIVVRTCRADSFEHVHFDTRQFSHIVWDTPEDLRAKLTARLKATVTVPLRLRSGSRAPENR